MGPEGIGIPQAEIGEIPAVDEVKKIVTTKEEAATMVKAFWEAVPHGYDFIRQASSEGDGIWTEDLTAGDRTEVRRTREGWLVKIRGNHQPLSKEATAYLQQAGLL